MFAPKALATILLVAALGAPASAQGGSAGPGDAPDYQFNNPLLNGRGVTSLSDLRGKPVLIEFWGTR